MAERRAGDTCSAGTPAAEKVRPEDGDDLLARWELWKTEHPRRNYVQVGPHASPYESSQQQAGCVYSRGNSRLAGAASGAPGAAAPGAPAPVSTRYSEVVRVPFAQRIRQGAGVRRVAGEPSLFQYGDSASGETYQHTTSIQRMAALANSHPLVATMRLSCLRHVLDEDAVVDHEGRAKTTADDFPPRHQSPYDLSLSLARSGKVFKVGLSTRRMHPTLFSLWWKAQGPGWKDSEINRARATFFDLAELDGDHILTAHGVDEAEADDIDESDSSNSAADAESSGDDEGREDDDEESPGAASGALRGFVKQRRLVGLCSLERSRVVQRATEYRRRAFFNDVICPRGPPPTGWLVSDRTLHKRRTRTSKLVHILERDSCPVPLEIQNRHRAPERQPRQAGGAFLSGASLCDAQDALPRLAQNLAPRPELPRQEVFLSSFPCSSRCLFWQEPRRVCGACAPCVGRAARNVWSDKRALLPPALVQQAQR